MGERGRPETTGRRLRAHGLQVQRRGKVLPVGRWVRWPRLHPAGKHQPGEPGLEAIHQLRAAARTAPGTVPPVTRTELERLHGQLW